MKGAEPGRKTGAVPVGPIIIELVANLAGRAQDRCDEDARCDESPPAHLVVESVSAGVNQRDDHQREQSAADTGELVEPADHLGGPPVAPLAHDLGEADIFGIGQFGGVECSVQNAVDNLCHSWGPREPFETEMVALEEGMEPVFKFCPAFDGHDHLKWNRRPARRRPKASGKVSGAADLYRPLTSALTDEIDDAHAASSNGMASFSVFQRIVLSAAIAASLR